jgi:hypothetical protein
MRLRLFWRRVATGCSAGTDHADSLQPSLRVCSNRRAGHTTMMDVIVSGANVLKRTNST